MMLLSGVTVLPGNEAPSAARSPFIMRPYDQELLLCMRQYRKTSGGVNSEPTLYAFQNAGSTVGVGYTHPVPMRAAPTITTVGSWSVSNCAQPTFSSDATSYIAYVTAAGSGPTTFQPNNSGIVRFDARL
jgi:hypothetical protein